MVGGCYCTSSERVWHLEPKQQILCSEFDLDKVHLTKAQFPCVFTRYLQGEALFFQVICCMAKIHSYILGHQNLVKMTPTGNLKNKMLANKLNVNAFLCTFNFLKTFKGQYLVPIWLYKVEQQLTHCNKIEFCKNKKNMFD